MQGQPHAAVAAVLGVVHQCLMIVESFICYAEHEDGTPLTDEELEAIEPDQVYDLLMNHLY